MNNDLRDDIVVLDKGRQVHILYQDFSGKKLIQKKIATLDSVGYWSVVAFDIDNDGDKDLCFGTEEDELKVLYQDVNSWRLTRIPAFDLYSQGMNAVDINEDGWTDLFVCNDIGFNAVFINDQGSLVRNDNYFRNIDSAIVAGNYGSVWSDYDNDGDLDLYLAKCKAFALPGDPHRRNILYENDNGVFQDRSDELKLAMDDQSWTGDFADIDNDGDFECIVANHGSPCRVLEESGGEFKDIHIQTGVVFNSAVIQNVNHDFNNDGWLDILFTGQQEIIYANQGDGTFQFAPTFFRQFYRGNSATMGDLNYDGKVDLYMTYGNLIGEASTIEDEVWINQTSEGNFLDFYLHGTQSNPDAIGAKVRIFGPWGQQVREIKCGQSYGIQNSQVLRFGLGDAAKIDSAIIEWPKGYVEKIDKVDANSYIYSLENVWTFSSLSSHPYRVDICNGDSVTLAYPAFTPLTWNTANSGNEIKVKREGFYQASFEHMGKSYTLPGTEVHIDPYHTNEISGATDCICSGTSIKLDNTARERVLWNKTKRASSIEADTTGWYYFQYFSDCQTPLTSDSIYLEVLQANLPISKGKDSLAKNQKITIAAAGDSILWFADSFAQQPISTSDSLLVENIKRDTTFWIANVVQKTPSSDVIGPTLIDLDTSLNQVNRIQYFSVDKDVVLESIKAMAEIEGPRVIVIQDFQRRDVYRDTVMLQLGENTIFIQKEIKSGPGLYQLSTDEMFNMVQFGTPTPRLLFKRKDVDYPYKFDNNLTVFHSSFSTNRWDNFFEWKVSSAPEFCISERIPYQIFYKQTTPTEFQKNQSLIYPSIIIDQVKTTQSHSEAIIFDSYGHEIIRGASLELINWKPFKKGIYFIQLRLNDGQTYSQKVIKM